MDIPVVVSELNVYCMHWQWLSLWGTSHCCAANEWNSLHCVSYTVSVYTVKTLKISIWEKLTKQRQMHHTVLEDESYIYNCILELVMLMWSILKGRCQTGLPTMWPVHSVLMFLDLGGVSSLVIFGHVTLTFIALVQLLICDHLPVLSFGSCSLSYQGVLSLILTIASFMQYSFIRSVFFISAQESPLFSFIFSLILLLQLVVPSSVFISVV